MIDPVKISKGGKLGVYSKVKVNRHNLASIYTPGVAEVVRAIAKNPSRSMELTWRGNTVAVVSDGTAVLGLGKQDPRAALAVMEAKAVLFKEFGGVNAVPIVLDTTDPKEIIKTVTNIAPSFGGINLEDIAAPACFEVERALEEKLEIPVFHDDQWGTAIVVLAGLLNALKVVGKKPATAKVVIVGAGAAGTATATLLLAQGFSKIIVFDSQGPLDAKRKDLNLFKKELAQKTNPEHFSGNFQEALVGADVFIGLSKAGLLLANDVSRMNARAIIFAMANPVPEIMPQEALKGGAEVVATGRSDFPNQINNALVFPGIFKGALQKRVAKINLKTKIKAALRLAELVPKPSKNKIIPRVGDKKAVQAVASCF